MPLLGLAAFFVMLAVVVPAEGWPPLFLLLTYSVWVVTLGLQMIKVERSSTLPPVGLARG